MILAVQDHSRLDTYGGIGPCAVKGCSIDKYAFQKKGCAGRACRSNCAAGCIACRGNCAAGCIASCGNAHILRIF